MSETSYRKKPVVIQAMGPVTYDNRFEVADWCQGSAQDAGPSGVIYAPGLLSIKTLEGEMWAADGDWIIRGVQGEFYPCKPDIFAATYEPAGNDLSVDQARTQDLERRGLHGAVVRSDGLNKAVIECRFEDVDRVLEDRSICGRCRELEAELDDLEDKVDILQKAFVEILNDKDALALLLENRN